MSRNDHPVTGANDGRVRTNWCSHTRKARRSERYYPYRVARTTRRTFIQAGGRLVVAGATSFGVGSLLGACAGTDDGGALPDDVQIVQRFPQNLVVGQQRIPISLASGGGLLTSDGSAMTPAQLSARIMRIDGDRDELVVEDLIAPRHDADLATPYWPFRTSINKPGFYRLILAGGPSDGAAFQVFARGDIAVPSIGDALPPFDTPTINDARGVNPVCTRQPAPCPLHDITLRDALTLGRPIAYLVGTPAHCSTGTCAPALAALVAARQRVGDSFTFIHAEVYADVNATQVAPAVKAVSMNYEPALFVADARGTITSRLDAVFDAVELQTVIGS